MPVVGKHRLEKCDITIGEVLQRLFYDAVYEIATRELRSALHMSDLDNRRILRFDPCTESDKLHHVGKPARRFRSKRKGVIANRFPRFLDCLTECIDDICVFNATKLMLRRTP